MINGKQVLLSSLTLSRIPCRAATTAALPANTYNNGTAGVGATITANANGAIAAQDGVTLVLNDRLLIKNEATQSHNGIYKLTQVGTAGTPFILTRAIDANTGGSTGKLRSQLTVSIEEGTSYTNTTWRLQVVNNITVGTTSLTFDRSNIFGSDYQSFTSLNEQSTSSASFVSVTGSPFSTTSLISGTYRINWQCGISGINNNDIIAFQVLVNGTAITGRTGTGSTNASTITDSIGTDWRAISGFTSLSLSSGVSTIDVQWFKSAGAGSVLVRNVKIDLWRLI